MSHCLNYKNAFKFRPKPTDESPVFLYNCSRKYINFAFSKINPKISKQ